MKRKSKLLLEKGINSLMLAVEYFNRVDDRGRIDTVLIILDHSFEMLLKASILERGGKIRERRARETIGFDTCVRRALSTEDIKFLTDEEALTLQTINGLRDAAQHYLIDISEEQLYLHTQSGVTLFKDLLFKVFKLNLNDFLPKRVLPVSTLPPTDIVTLFESETEHIRRLLRPGLRKKTQAYNRLRPLAIFDATIRGEKVQPSKSELKKHADRLISGISWDKVFPAAAAVEINAQGAGASISLRITKKEGVPVHLLPPDTPGTSVIGIKRVNELDYYNLGRDQLAKHVGLSGPKTSAVIWFSKMKGNEDYCKEFLIGKTPFTRYSQKAIGFIKQTIAEHSIEAIWTSYWAEIGQKSNKKEVSA